MIHITIVKKSAAVTSQHMKSIHCHYIHMYGTYVYIDIYIIPCAGHAPARQKGWNRDFNNYSVSLVIGPRNMLTNWKQLKSGWWFQPLWEIFVSWDYYSQYMEKKCSKPQPEIRTMDDTCRVTQTKRQRRVRFLSLLFPFWEALLAGPTGRFCHGFQAASGSMTGSESIVISVSKCTVC